MADKGNNANEVAKLRKGDYVTVFGSPAGKRVLRDLMSRFHVGTSTHVPDAYDSAFFEGERNVVLFIMGIISKRFGEFDVNQELDFAAKDYEIREFK